MLTAESFHTAWTNQLQVTPEVKLWICNMYCTIFREVDNPQTRFASFFSSLLECSSTLLSQKDKRNFFWKLETQTKHLTSQNATTLVAFRCNFHRNLRQFSRFQQADLCVLYRSAEVVSILWCDVSRTGTAVSNQNGIYISDQHILYGSLFKHFLKLTKTLDWIHVWDWAAVLSFPFFHYILLNKLKLL